MKTTTAVIASLATLSQLACATYLESTFANYFSTGPVATNSWIREANTTLVLPKTNSPQVGNLALWPGMGTSGGDLIQALAISSDNGETCTTESGFWCITASTLESEQIEGTLVPAAAGSLVTMHYKYNDTSSQYDQTVSLNGTVVSKISTSSGHAQGWGTAIECQETECGFVPGHKYINTKLTMDVADPDYGQTLATYNATGELTTADGGLTWTVATIVIGATTFSAS
ncbi:hypothetical protein LTR36_001110 [Oleoguttula mirabilis]|uniref:Uncharacterized protein n=1 Tax=Oleoguttula mirabilis TaxID=1507867 RepID=A0AAV9JQH5_9PEZI|nr:hypothetical protein LTR36_001110 [Oleoguttula mirabilis]